MRWEAEGRARDAVRRAACPGDTAAISLVAWAAAIEGALVDPSALSETVREGTKRSSFPKGLSNCKTQINQSHHVIAIELTLIPACEAFGRAAILPVRTSAFFPRATGQSRVMFTVSYLLSNPPLRMIPCRASFASASVTSIALAPTAAERVLDLACFGRGLLGDGARGLADDARKGLSDSLGPSALEGDKESAPNPRERTSTCPPAVLARLRGVFEGVLGARLVGELGNMVVRRGVAGSRGRGKVKSCDQPP
jgi:hypothetical protein